MENCKVCDKSLEGAIKSVEKENGDFYIVCKGCGQVYYVSHDENGLTLIRKTRTGHNKKAYDQMKEAKALLNAAGVGVYSFKDDIHSDIKNSSELEEKKEEKISLNNEDNEFIDNYVRLFKSIGMENYPRERMEKILLTIKKNPKLSFDELLEEMKADGIFVGNLKEDESEDEDCENCEDTRCENHPSNQGNDIESTSRIELDKYIIEVEKDGEIVITFKKDEQSLCEFIKQADINDIKIISIHELKPVKIEKEVSYKLS